MFSGKSASYSSTENLMITIHNQEACPLNCRNAIWYTRENYFHVNKIPKLINKTKDLLHSNTCTQLL